VPRLLLYSEPIIISLVGVPYSGKSYLLAAMTWELRQRLPRWFGLSFADADPEGNHTLTEYENNLFRPADPTAPVSIIKTQMEDFAHYKPITLDGQSVRLARPFLFVLNPTAAQGSRRSHLVCLYDNAGEHFLPGADTATDPGTQHLARSRVLLYLFDPTQDQRFRARCRGLSTDPQLDPTWHAARQDSIFTEAILRIRKHGGGRPTDPIHRPVLVLVSKADVWGRLINLDLSSEPISRYDQASDSLAHLDMERIERVSKEVRNLLLDVTPDVVAAIESACTRVMYVPVSALGGSPESREAETAAGKGRALVVQPAEIQPRWVTVPLLYAFARWARGVIPTGKSAGDGGAREGAPDPHSAVVS